ncbi:MAG: DegT/DnrJ/EryC1/StrS aminotransferase family protein [Planctomycetes bacterium]|nr:DegT/DnrJ/EryC1/StrS aminotransferase family protein [Planctomycetota bacterium]
MAAARACGARVVFYSINRRLEPDLEEIERLCREGAHALFVIHFHGWAQPIDALDRIARTHGIPLIEDCALSFLSDAGAAPSAPRETIRSSVSTRRSPSPAAVCWSRTAPRSPG